ncbi:hypothetical protein RD792_007920 [Penstemon davidsonii]|uniref:EF-hand domain-containing protein n=1 Tax=Penstemon davidsonii TaxID=160366 RepID=A0ABR0D7N9_9LAMI|nr:hypothetical protein RD792_007920 [Penstemon davidsonii]
MAPSFALRLIWVNIFLIGIVQCRILSLDSSDNDLVSDGVDVVDDKISFNAPSIPNTCNHQYGFLPCAENAGGYMFQILVYQGLLIYGEKQIGKGSKVLFNIIGAGKFGGIIFRILMSLPSMMLMIVSGVFSPKGNAQSQVSLGVGIYAGMTVFSLTLQWGICVIFGRRDFLQNSSSQHIRVSSSNCLQAKEKLVVLKDTGVTIDRETQITAGIMLLSLIPYVIMQLNDTLNTSSESRVLILIALIVSSLSLVSYFGYQIMNPWIQQRSLDYSKYEMLRTGFLQHVQRHGQLVTEDGKLNTPVIEKLFADTDKDANKSITKAEMEKLVFDVIETGKVKLFQLFKEKKEHDPKEMDQIMSKILKHAETEVLKAESLVTPDGKPNIEGIQTLFKRFDYNGDKTISASELEQLISTVKFGDFQPKYEYVVKELFKDFDQDNNNTIDEPEFVEGVTKWLTKAINVANSPDRTKSVDKYDEIVWKQQVFDKWALVTSIFQVLLGIVILTFLGGPLMVSILQLSYAMSLPSFCISFVVVPLAMNGRAAITAILPASHKSERTASLTFSEIYGGVIMNNIAGLTTLLAIVYAKDLTWDFSAEVLTILVVCAIVGILAYSRTTYPLWTCILAFFLYPFSLGLFYFMQLFWRWN